MPTVRAPGLLSETSRSADASRPSARLPCTRSAARRTSDVAAVPSATPIPRITGARTGGARQTSRSLRIPPIASASPTKKSQSAVASGHCVGPRRRRRRERAARADGERDRALGGVAVVREQRPGQEEDALQPARQRLRDRRATCDRRRQRDVRAVGLPQRDPRAARDEVLVEPQHDARRGGREPRACRRVGADEVGVRARRRRERARDERRHREERAAAPASTSVSHPRRNGRSSVPPSRCAYPLGV